MLLAHCATIWATGNKITGKIRCVICAYWIKNVVLWVLYGRNRHWPSWVSICFLFFLFYEELQWNGYLKQGEQVLLVQLFYSCCFWVEKEIIFLFIRSVCMSHVCSCWVPVFPFLVMFPVPWLDHSVPSVFINYLISSLCLVQVYKSSVLPQSLSDLSYD